MAGFILVRCLSVLKYLAAMSLAALHQRKPSKHILTAPSLQQRQLPGSGKAQSKKQLLSLRCTKWRAHELLQFAYVSFQYVCYQKLPAPSFCQVNILCSTFWLPLMMTRPHEHNRSQKGKWATNGSSQTPSTKMKETRLETNIQSWGLLEGTLALLQS